MKSRDLSSFSIRKFLTDDAITITTFVHTLLDNDFRKPYSQAIITAYKKRFSTAYFLEHINRDAIYFGAFDGSTLVGIWLGMLEYGGVVFVDWIGVRQEYRKCGLASLLIRRGEEAIIKAKCHYVYLFTETQENIEFYTKRGFTLVGKHVNAWFGAQNEYILGKSLRATPFDESM